MSKKEGSKIMPKELQFRIEFGVSDKIRLYKKDGDVEELNPLAAMKLLTIAEHNGGTLKYTDCLIFVDVCVYA